DRSVGLRTAVGAGTSLAVARARVGGNESSSDQFVRKPRRRGAGRGYAGERDGVSAQRLERRRLEQLHGTGERRSPRAVGNAESRARSVAAWRNPFGRDAHERLS